MTASTTNWRISPAAWVPIGLAIVAEATSNALRAYELGTFLEAFTVNLSGARISISGAVLVLGAVALSLSQARAAWIAFTPNGDPQQRIVGAVVAALLLSVSVGAMALTIIEAQRIKAGSEEGDHDKHIRAQTDYTHASSELSVLLEARTRTPAQVSGDIAAAKLSAKVLEYTRDCTDFAAGLAQFRKACQPLLALRAEMAGAQRKVELESKLPELKEAAGNAPAVKTATAVEELAFSFWGWAMGIAVVVVATFGPVIFARAEASEVLVPRPEASPELLSPNERDAEAGPNRPKGAEIPSLARSRRSADLPKRPNHQLSLDAIRTDLLIRNATGRAFGSQKEAARAYGYSESRFSELSKIWEAEGLIPKRRMVGKSKQLALRE